MDPHERELLAEACRTLDELDQLRAALRKDGVTARGSRGQVRTHPALVELRQGRGELRRLLDALEIPEAVDVESTVDAESAGAISLDSRRAQKAARARWKGRAAVDHREAR